MGVEANDLAINRLESQRQGSVLEGDDAKPTVESEINHKYGKTQRGLKPRHVHLMAIGGSIGVGLWVSRLQLPNLQLDSH